MAGLPEWAYLAVALVVGVLGSARLTKLVVEDSWPPIAWLRAQYLARAPENWSDLVLCAGCFAPYVVAPNLAWAILSDLHWSWWLFNGWLAAAYAAAMIVWRDMPGGEN